MPREYLSDEQRRQRLEEMRRLAGAKNGRCLAEEYVHCLAPLLFACARHGRFAALPKHIAAGSWCDMCRREADKPRMAHRLHTYVTAKGGILLTPYVNARTQVTIHCPEHGPWSATPDNLLNKQSWCARCSKGKPRGKRQQAVAPGAPAPSLST